jgi:transcriptional enhancer factor
MEHRRHILPSQSYPLHQLSLEEGNGISSRQPLSDAAGNAQLLALAPSGIHHEGKLHSARMESYRSMYTPMPTLPSQPARPPTTNSLEARRQHTRRRRHMKYSRNPIVNSPQYQAYRARQTREGKGEDVKWPLVLEMAFLDGSCCSRCLYVIRLTDYSTDRDSQNGPAEVLLQGETPRSE